MLGFGVGCRSTQPFTDGRGQIADSSLRSLRDRIHHVDSDRSCFLRDITTNSTQKRISTDSGTDGQEGNAYEGAPKVARGFKTTKSQKKVADADDHKNQTDSDNCRSDDTEQIPRLIVLWIDRPIHSDLNL